MPPKDAVDPKAVAAAAALARKTGQNQPVKDAKGKVVYYVDVNGNKAPEPPSNAPGGSGSTAPKPGTYTLNDGSTETVREDGTRIIVRKDGHRQVIGPQGDLVDVGAPGRGGITPTGKTAAEDSFDKKDAAKAQANLTPEQEQAQADQRMARSMLVNGVQQDPVDDPDPLGLAGYKQDPKTRQITDANGQNVDAGSYGALVYQQQQLSNSTFSALQLPTGYNGSTTFMFSKGPNGYAPMAVDPTTLGNRMDDRRQAINASRGQDPLAGQTSATNYMTIADGIQKIVNMSVGDKDAYNEMVVQLNKAGYFASQSGNMNYVPTNQLPLNTYSRNTGLAAVEAMQDLSVAQAAGYQGDFKQWLTDRSQGYEDYVKSGAGYNPVNRSYQDPATLAASAKSAAQQAIGRNLTPAEEAKFEAAFHGKENTAYNEIDQYGRAKATANLTGASALPAGTPTGYTMPDTSGEADQYVNQDPQFAAEKQGYAGLELTKGLIGFLKGGGF